MDDTTIVAEIIDLSRSIERLSDNVGVVKVGQESMASDISKIKEAVYNPDEGIYARIKILEAQINELKSWKDSQTKFMWLVVSGLVSLTVANLWANFWVGG